MQIIFFILLFIIGGFWRRLFGGWLYEVPIISNRFFQHIVGFLILSIILLLNGINYILSFIIAFLIQGIFWSPGHGMCFDLGRNKDNITDDDKRRYIRTIGYRFVELVLPKKYRYGFLYDFVLMSFRYILPSIIISLFLPRFFLIAIIISPVYAFCWELTEKEKDNLNLPKFISHSTALAEFLCGGLVYSLLNILI